MKKRLLCKTRILLLGMMMYSMGMFAQPKSANNPIAKYYSNTNDIYPGWIDDLKWNSRIDMSTYSNGSNNFEKFENARDELYNRGGGVLYYPAGVYEFTIPDLGPNGRGLMLKSGVVILGETPTGDKVARDDGAMELGTKFRFTFSTKPLIRDGAPVNVEYPGQWNIVGIQPSDTEQLKDVKNVGIVWVDMDGAAIYFGLQLSWATRYGASPWLGSSVVGPWADRVPDGTHPMDPFLGYTSNTPYLGAGSGRLIFGCVLNNSCVTNDQIIKYTGTISGITNTATPLYPYKFAARLTVHGSHVFVANNSLPKPTKAFRYETLVRYRYNATPYNQAPHFATEQILFDYGKTGGIDINKSLCGTVLSADRRNFLKSPYMENNVVIDGNYVYSHGHKGYEIAGEWVIVKNNKNERDFLQTGDNVYGVGSNWALTMDGFDMAYETDDNMSRGFDLGGKNMWAGYNYFNNTGSHPGNDGEGILCQQHNDIDVFSWAWTHNTKGPNGDRSYIGSWDSNNFGFMVFKNDIAPGMVGAIAGNRHLYSLSVVNNIAQTVGTDGIKHDITTTCPAGSPLAPIDVQALWDDTAQCVKVKWADIAADEIGYRLDRRVLPSGAWTTLMYRPKISNTDPINVASYGFTNETDVNRPEWFDYYTANGSEVEYRVVALNCNDDDTGASAVSDKVKIGYGKGNGPSVNISSPKNNAVLTAPATFTIQTAPSDSIVRVEFFKDSVLLGEVAAAPFNYNLSNVAPGHYSLFARAFDNKGDTAVSSAITIIVNDPPSVSITRPVANSSYLENDTVAIEAVAADTDGDIAKIEFYQDSVKIGEVTSAPYQFNLIDVEVGTFNLTAKAFDNRGASTTSAPVSISVKTPTMVIYAINAGGKSYTAQDGNVYGADAYFTGGKTSTSLLNLPILGTNDDKLYQSERYGNFTYSLPVTRNDNYEVTLKFAEYFWVLPYMRLFDVNAEGEKIISRLDIFKTAGGMNKAYDVVKNVNVTDGALTLKFATIRDNAKVSAILVKGPAQTKVSITSPAKYSLFTEGDSISVTTSTIGTVSKVEFFRDTTKLGEDVSAPFSFDWVNAPAGSYKLIARATDSKGMVVRSHLVPVTVNAKPVVNITSPANNAAFAKGTKITISADASDSDGTIAKVEFFRDTVKLGESTLAPYSFEWTNAVAGTYNLTAKATDDKGYVTTSAVVTIVVSLAPVVSITSPANNALIIAGTTLTINASATDPDGSVALVEFYQGTTKLGEATTSPFSYAWENIPLGSYSLKAVATDDKGVSKTSIAIAIVVNSAPVVSITSPTDTATFTAGPTITVGADAFDSDGTITKVEFFVGNNKLGEDLTSPYNFDWAYVSAGNYVLTAKATDNKGTVTTSAGVNVSVNPANANAVLYAVNSGKDVAYTSQSGIVYTVDARFTGGATTGRCKTCKILNSPDSILYKSERYGNFYYKFPATVSGYYEVTLKFAETYHSAAGKRVFDVKAEDNTIISALDIFKTSGGQNVAYDVVKTINVTDGELTIQFISIKDGAKICAILVKGPSSQLKSKSIATDVAEQPVAGFDAYPSPATDVLTVEGYAEGKTHVIVHSSTGKTVFVEKYNGSFKENINISDWSAGIYIVKAVSNGSTEIRKVIVK